jgi:hypothetical protein
MFWDIQHLKEGGAALERQRIKATETLVAAASRL